jgi:hypothetical protein
MYQDYRDAGLMVLAVYSETEEGALPTADDLAGWASRYGITDTPVMADANSAIYWRFGTGSLPSMTLLGPGMEVLETGWVDEGQIAEHLGGE